MPWPPSNPRPQAAPASQPRAYGLGASLVLVSACVLLVGLLDGRGQGPLGLANLVAFTAVTSVAWWWQRRRLGARTPTWSWGLPELASFKAVTVVGVVLATAGGSLVLSALANLLVSWWPLPPSLERALERLSNLDHPLPVLLALVVIAPLTEEGLFRGLLLPSLAQRHGTGAAVVLSALLFGAVHLNPWQALPALLAGVYLGALRVRGGGLALPLLGHALFNGLPVALALAGWVLPGYNTPSSGLRAEALDWPWPVGGALVLVVGVALSLRPELFRRRLF